MATDPNSKRSPPPTRCPPAREPMSPQVMEMAAERLQLVARAKRIALLEVLSEGEAGVQEIADRIGSSHQNTSYHLAPLWRAGILSRRSEGSATLYAIEDWSAWWVVEQIVGWVQSCQDE